MSKNLKLELPMINQEGVFAVVTTEYKGVFFGYIEDHDVAGRTVLLTKNPRCCIAWRNRKGWMGLASDGPDDQCQISKHAPKLMLYGVTAIAPATDEAVKKWQSA